MQMKRSLPWIMFALVGFVCLWLMYKLLDQSVTLDHQSRQAELLEQQRDVLAYVLNHVGVGASEKTIRELVAERDGDSAFDKGSSEIVAGQVSFHFANGRLILVDAGAGPATFPRGE